MNNIISLCNIIYIYVTISCIIVCYLLASKLHKKYICYDKQQKRAYYKKVLTGVFSSFLFFSVLAEPFAMNNGEGGEQIPLSEISLSGGQSLEGGATGGDGVTSVSPESIPDALYCMFLDEHGNQDIVTTNSSSIQSNCCRNICSIGMTRCLITNLIAGACGGLGVGLGGVIAEFTDPSMMLAATSGGGLACYFFSMLAAYYYGGIIVSKEKRENLEAIDRRMQSLIEESISRGRRRSILVGHQGQPVTTQPSVAAGPSAHLRGVIVTEQTVAVGASASVGASSTRGSILRSSQRGDQGTEGLQNRSRWGEQDTDPIYEEVWTYAVELIPGYSYEGQVGSLLGMQCVLTGVSIQVPQKLRRLALKAYEKIPQMYLSLQGNKVSSPSIANYGKLLKATKNFANQKQKHIPYYVFAFTDDYKANLERKVRSGQAGIIAELCNGVHFGLTYSRHNDEKKEYTGMQLGKGRGSVKAKSEIESIAAVVTFNADRPGITGHFASCYGWGIVKNKRFFTHAGRETSSSGSPAISITGGLVQIGYNLYISKSCSVTPYVEGVLSIAKWKPYNEKRGDLPCKLSESSESIFEKSIGLRSDWRVSESSILQTWISGISGSQTSSNVSLQPLVAPMKRYEVSVPMRNKNYLRAECGATYVSKITDSLFTGATMLFSFVKRQKLHNQQINTYVQYVF